MINLTRMTLRTLLHLDIVTHGLRIGLLLAAMSLGLLSTGAVLLIIAASCAGGLAVAGWRSLPKKAPASFRQTSASNWRYGRWLLLETIVYSASTQIYIYLTALWIDKASVGGLSAVLLLFSVLNVPLIGLMNVLVPVARRRLLEGDHGAWRRSLMRAGMVLVAASACVGLAICTAPATLLTLLFGPSFAQYAPLVPIVAAQFVLQAFAAILSAAFRTAELPQVGFAAKALSALATLAIAYPLISQFGVMGAAIGLMTTQAIWVSVYIGCVWLARFPTHNVR